MTTHASTSAPTIPRPSTGDAPTEATGLPVASSRQMKRALRDLAQRRRGPLATTTVLFWLAAGCGAVGPWLLGLIIDRAPGGTALTVGVLGGAMAAALLAQAVFLYFATRGALRTGEQTFAELREGFVDSVVRLPLARVEAAGVGDLLTRTTRDVQNVSDAVQFGIPQLSVAAATIVATVVASVLVDPLVTIAMVSGVPPLVLAARWYLRRSGVAYSVQATSYSAMNDVTANNAEGVRTIDTLSLADIRTQAAHAAIRGVFFAAVRTANLQTVLLPVMTFAFAIPVIAILLWGGWLVGRDLSTPGSVAAVTLYAVQLATPSEQLIQWIDRLQSSIVSFGRLLGVREVAPGPTAVVAASRDQTIELRAVTFAYRPDQLALRDISLTVRPGERLAIVGPSGSGKSTLARVLSGTYVPLSGTATMGGVSLSGRIGSQQRRDVALLTQESHVFYGSISENLRLGRPDADDDTLRRALDVVGADWVTTLPDGLATRVGAGGLVLTPAQAQHIALARLVAMDPQSVVLDEATSMLDPQLARSLEQSLSAALRGRTVIAVAHRLHTAHDADRIAVMVGGSLVELGSHADLLDRDGHYAHLWQAWQDAG